MILVYISNMFSCLPFRTVAKTKAEREEQVKDTVYDAYYQEEAHKHIGRILAHYDKDIPQNFEKALQSLNDVGLMHPYADSVKYLRVMKHMNTLKE